MKVLIATDKPFAKVAVDGIRKEIEDVYFDGVFQAADQGRRGGFERDAS